MLPGVGRCVQRLVPAGEGASGQQAVPMHTAAGPQGEHLVRRRAQGLWQVEMNTIHTPPFKLLLYT